MKKAACLLTFLIVLFLVASCRTKSDDPVAALRDYMHAFDELNIEKVSSLTCPSSRAEIKDYFNETFNIGSRMPTTFEFGDTGTQELTKQLLETSSLQSSLEYRLGNKEFSTATIYVKGQTKMIVDREKWRIAINAYFNSLGFPDAPDSSYDPLIDEIIQDVEFRLGSSDVESSWPMVKMSGKWLVCRY